jgi:hypothetical protein
MEKYIRTNLVLIVASMTIHPEWMMDEYVKIIFAKI